MAGLCQIRLTVGRPVGHISRMNLDPRSILDFIRRMSDRPMRISELAKALAIPPSDYRRFRKIVKQLLASGELVRLKRNRIGLAAEMDIVIGPISVTRSGNGFLL